MRLLLAVCLVGVGIFTAACKTSDDSSDSGSAGATPAARTSNPQTGGTKAAKIKKTGDKKLTIGFANYAAVIPLYQSMIAGVKDEAAKNGWKVVVTDSQFDPGKEVNDVMSLIAQHVDVIICSPGDEDALLPAYKAAADAGIPMISIANQLNPKENAWELGYVGLSSVKMGEIETQKLIDAIDGKGDILRLQGPAGIAFVRDTKTGMDNVLAKNPDVKVVFQQNAKILSPEEGFRLANDGLTAHPDAKGIWAQDDEIAVGAVRALQKKKLNIPVSWNGGTPQAMDLAAEGKLVGIVLPTYDWGQKTVQLIHDSAVNGTAFPYNTESSNFPLDSAQQAKDLIAKCPDNPKQIWCLGRK